MTSDRQFGDLPTPPAFMERDDQAAAGHATESKRATFIVDRIRA